MSNDLEKGIKENIKAKFEQIGDQKLDFISKFIKNKGQYQEIGDYIVFRLFNSVSEREEVFIGNVLFNDYISKLLLRTYEAKENYNGQIELVYNDLENFYYVVKQDDFSLEELEDDFKDYFAENLEEVFFADEDLEKEIYGEFDNLLLCNGYNYLSLPFTILPNFLEKKFKNQMIKIGKENYTIKDNLKLFTQYFNVSTMNYEHQSFQSFISKMLINNEIDNIELFKDIVKFNYNMVEFKFDLIKKLFKVSKKLNTKGRKTVKKYLNDEVTFKELKNKLKKSYSDNIIGLIKRLKEEENFVKIVELIVKISSNEELILKLKQLREKFDLIEIDQLTKKPGIEYNKYIKYYFEAERYSIELLNFLQRFVNNLKKTDKKKEIINDISKLVGDCWEIIKKLDETKRLFNYFGFNIDDIKKFFKEFFKQNSIYKVIFNDYLEIKDSILAETKEKFLDSIGSSKMAEKVDLLIDMERKNYSELIAPNLTNDIKKVDNYNENKCFICFKNNANIIARNVITGFNSFKFVNQEANVENHRRICINCGIYLWLKLKYLGSYYSGNVFPEKRNIVFFYGSIPKDRINQIQGVLNSLYYCTQNPSVYTYESIDNSIRELEKNKEGNNNSEVDDLLQELIESDKEDKKEKPAKVPPTIWSWYKNGQQADKVDTHIFSVGQGKNKLYTFVLPYALNRSDEIQKKFSQNKVAVYSMLSFLSRLTGVQGGFYYLSTPKLTDEFSEENIFYYKDEPKGGTLKEYELLTEVAWELVDPRNVSGSTGAERREKAFERRLKLANDLEKLPLITLSKIYRELVDDEIDSNYKNLSSIRNLGITNLLPLIKVSNNIRSYKSQEGGIKFMGQQIETEELKGFTDDLFSELVLISGIFPKSFSKAPTEFEKYPRLLIKKILKYDGEKGKDVLAGYREWSAKVLHSAKEFYGEDQDKEKVAERLERIRQSIVKHKQALSQKSNLLYLKRSLFGWITEFLYPLYSLVDIIDENIKDYQEDEIEQIKDSSKLDRIKQKFNDLDYDFEESFELAKELLKNNADYYKKRKENKQDKEE